MKTDFLVIAAAFALAIFISLQPALRREADAKGKQLIFAAPAVNLNAAANARRTF